MRLGWLWFVLVGACSPSPPAPEAPRRAATIDPDIATLEERLDRVERELPKATGDAREALLEQRLVLTIALAELARRGPLYPERADLDDLLEAAEDAVANARAETRRKIRSRSRPPLRRPREAKGEAKGEVKGEASKSDDKKSDDKPAPPPPPPPPPEEAEEEASTVDKARVADEERPRALMSAVRRRTPEIEDCLGGVDSDVTLQVTLRLDAGGSVRDPKVAGVGAGPAACVADVLRTVSVIDHDGSARVVRFPLYFSR